MSSDFSKKNKPTSPLSVSDISRILKEIGKKWLKPGNDASVREFKQHLKEFGLQGLENPRPPLPKFNRKATRQQTAAILIRLCLEHPDWSCNRLTQELNSLNVAISANMVYNILVEHQLSSKRERLSKLSQRQIAVPADHENPGETKK